MGRTRYFAGWRNGATLASAAAPLRDWVELGLQDVPATQRRYDARRKSVAASEWIQASELAGLGQFDFDPQLDFGQDRIEARVA